MYMLTDSMLQSLYSYFVHIELLMTNTNYIGMHAGIIKVMMQTTLKFNVIFIGQYL